jgi:hypothetical protein
MAGRTRLIVADITLGKARGKALVKELGAMNQEEKGFKVETYAKRTGK